MSDVFCPYCDEGQEINHDDGYGYDENLVHNQQCYHCDKYFTFSTSISFDYYPEKADCLNGGEHDWKLTNTFPDCFKRMACTMCDEHRDLTEQERLNNNIPSREEYFNSLKND